MFRTNIKKKVLYSKTYQSAKSVTKEAYRLEETLNTKLIFVFEYMLLILHVTVSLSFSFNRILKFHIHYSVFSVS